MSSREERIRGLNKKEKVVVLAKEDPFLKVEEIAQLAETTSHYVRTVLSEANLSLTELREKYARENKDTNSNYQDNLLEEILDFSLLNLTLEKERKNTLLKDSSYYKQFNNKAGFSIESTKLFSRGEKPLLLSTYFIWAEEKIKYLSQLKVEKELVFSDIKIGIELPSTKIKELLQLDGKSLVLILYQKILSGQEVKGIEKIYFNPGEIDLLIKDGRIKLQDKK